MNSTFQVPRSVTVAFSAPCCRSTPSVRQVSAAAEPDGTGQAVRARTSKHSRHTDKRQSARQEAAEILAELNGTADYWWWQEEVASMAVEESQACEAVAAFLWTCRGMTKKALRDLLLEQPEIVALDPFELDCTLMSMEVFERRGERQAGRVR